MSLLKIKRVLISVYYKDKIIDFAKFLESEGIEILSTGGTADILEKNKVHSIKIEELIDQDNFFGGKVKTLHPLIHSCISNKRDGEVSKYNLQPIDMVIVNQYPFENLVLSGESSINTLVEMIDIGGQALLRAAAKNYKYVCPVPSYKFYDHLAEEMKSGGIREETRLNMAVSVFYLTSYYDSLIARTLSHEERFNSKITIPLHREEKLRYGENSHQMAAYYSIPGSKEKKLSDFFMKGKLHGKELSYNNIQDISSTIKILSDLPGESCVVIKHSNPCGAAVRSNTYESFKSAYEGDKISIFGGIVGFKGDIDERTAVLLNEIFLEIIIARRFDNNAIEILKKKKNIRLMEYEKWQKTIFNEEKFFESKRVIDGFILQTKDDKNPFEEDFKCVTEILPDEMQCEDLKFAQTIVKHVKSNAIIVAKNKMLLGVGAGQMNRVTSAKIALDWAGEKSVGAVMASDAYFPKDDTVRLAGERGIKAIIQPGGSIRDQDSINACNELGISMVFTGIRHFSH